MARADVEGEQSSCMEASSLLLGVVSAPAKPENTGLIILSLSSEFWQVGPSRKGEADEVDSSRSHTHTFTCTQRGIVLPSLRKSSITLFCFCFCFVFY